MVFVDVGAWSQGMGLRQGWGIEVAGAGIMDRIGEGRANLGTMRLIAILADMCSRCKRAFASWIFLDGHSTLHFPLR